MFLFRLFYNPFVNIKSMWIKSRAWDQLMDRFAVGAICELYNDDESEKPFGFVIPSNMVSFHEGSIHECDGNCKECSDDGEPE